MRFIDTMLAFPGILTALVVLAVLGTGTREVAITLGITAIPGLRATGARDRCCKRKSATT